MAELKPAEKRLLALWKRASEKERREMTPAVRVRAKAIEKKAPSKMTTSEDKADQINKLKREVGG
jgi:hypothetical protein